MRHGLYRWILGLALALPGAGWGQPASQVPVTPYSINLLKAANQSNAWYALGIGASNQTQVTNWITTPGAGSVGSTALGSTALSLITNAAAGAAQVATNDLNTALVGQIEAATNDLNTALVAQIEAATNGWVGGSGTNILPLNNVWTGDSNVFSGAVSAAGFIGDLTGTATWADYADSAGTTAYADEAQGAHELINGADEVLLAADSTNLTVAAGSRLVGDGGGVTNLNASSLASGTIPAARFAVGQLSNWVDGAYSQVTSNTASTNYSMLDSNLNFYHYDAVADKALGHTNGAWFGDGSGLTGVGTDNAIPNANGAGTNTTFKSVMTTTPILVTNYQNWIAGGSAAYTNRTILAFDVQSYAEKPGIWFTEGNGSYYTNAGIWYWPNHDNVGNPELLFDCSGSIALATHGIQVGVSSSVQPTFMIFQNMNPASGQAFVNSSTNLWECTPLLFKAGYFADGASTITTSGGVEDYCPAVMGRATDTNGNAEIGVYSAWPCLPIAGTSFEYTTNNIRLTHAFRVGPSPSFLYSGGQIGKRSTPDALAPAVALDFGLHQCVDMAPTEASVSFYTTNTAATGTNYEQRVFLIRANLGTITPTWPSGWTWLGDVPATIADGQLLRLRLESIGAGESNVLAQAQAGTNTAFVYDPDASNFVALASITSKKEKLALNNLVIAAKAHGWWNQCDVVYPFVGDDITNSVYNLRTNNWHVTWTVPPDFSTNGVTFNGTDDYGNTGFRPTDEAGKVYTTNSAHVFVYIGSPAWPKLDAFFIGAYQGYPTPVATIGRTAAGMVGRLNDSFNDVAFSSIVAGTNGTGCFLVNRTSATNMDGYLRALTCNPQTAATTMPPHYDFFVGCQNNTGTPTYFTDANMRGLSFGSAITNTAAFLADWEAFEDALGRGVQ